jgi:hypothetical protein
MLLALYAGDIGYQDGFELTRIQMAPLSAALVIAGAGCATGRAQLLGTRFIVDINLDLTGCHI